MEVIQIVKRVNNTELGKGNTHEKYILVPRELDVREFFPADGGSQWFTDKASGTRTRLRYTSTREKRIVGLSDFYSAHGLEAGDTVMLERWETAQGERQYFISCRKNSSSLVFSKLKNGFEALTPERLGLLDGAPQSSRGLVEVRFLGEIRKRQDSPELTRIYDVAVGGKSLADDFRSKDMLEIRVQGERAWPGRVRTWEKYRFRMEADDE